MKFIKKIMAVFALIAFAVSSFGFSTTKVAQAAPLWDLSGNYVINMEYLGTPYLHDMSLTQDGLGNLTGSGGSPAGTNVYTWVISSGSIDGSTFSFDANYTATADAVTPQTVLHVEGTVAEDGTLSGTWSDNYQGGQRSGDFSSESGLASPIENNQTVKVTVVKYIDGSAATALSADNANFTMNATWDATNIGAGSGQFTLSPTGFNNPNPYQATTADMSSGATYSISEAMDSTTGVSCDVDNAAPFSLVGYTSGDTLEAAIAATPSTIPPALTNITSDKFIIVWNHDCSNIHFGLVTTNAATNITASNATLNGMNGISAATGHSFWVSLSPFSTASSTLPANVYSTADLGAITANTAFSAPLSSVVGLPTITTNTTYYFVAWSNVDGTWHPGEVLSFNTGESIGGDVSGNGVLTVTSIDTVDSSASADNTYENGWKYIFHITVPTDEPDLAMKFADWTKTGGGGTIPVANNMRISSSQANNSGATVTLTAANTYSSPVLHITSDLNPSMDGMQVQVVVEVKIPTSTPSGSYATTYGVLTN